MNNYTKILWIFIMFIVTITINGLYFEYCVSRDLPSFLSILATIIIVSIDVLVLINTVKNLIKLLKL